jgi:DNA-binding winged helix-turn-helix (wHTH) protein/Tol biopolymer transport system component
VGVPTTQETVRFGLFELDSRSAQLTRNGTSIRLPQQPLRLLSILVESPGEIVTREQLRERLWPSDVFVDFDHGLNKSIQKLRDALGDSAASPRYIETIPRVGYRFIAPVHNGLEPSAVDATPRPPQIPPPAPTPAGIHRTRWLVAAAAILAIAATAATLYVSIHLRPAIPTYTQITDFTDSAVAPALSPDGHILAFVRGDASFMSTGQIYVKMLPDGEAKLISSDLRPKYGLAFSPDGSQIAYSVIEEPGFSTYAVSTLGGDSHLLLKNAAGLTWLDPQHYLFSRIRSGLHMGIVTQSVTGDAYRELHFPPHERAMDHYSLPSPDRRNMLIVEMNGQGDWSMCQLISIAPGAQPKPVGPQGRCTDAGWSPDGSWMYFVAEVNGQNHIWRQRYPDGSPEQITFGPSDEQGLVVEPTGRSLITSIGENQSSIWIHDGAGERSLSSEGEIVARPSPSFAANDKILYYLVRKQPSAEPELRRLTLDTGTSEPVFPGTTMDAYDVSPDGKQIVYTSTGRDGKSHLWIAPVDRNSPARRIGRSGEAAPHFGPHGQILFRATEGNANYLEQMNQDGSSTSKVAPYPILQIQSVSPARKWVTAIVAYSDGSNKIPMVMTIPTDGGAPRRICATYCIPAWSSDGKFLYVPVEDASRKDPGRSLALPLGPDEALPPLPDGGIPPFAQPDAIPGAHSLNRAYLIPGNDPNHYAYVETTVHRNLYRITLP